MALGKWRLCFVAFALPLLGGPIRAQEAFDWKPHAYREGMLPECTIENRQGEPLLVLRAKGKEALDGAWTCSRPVEGGKFYRFSVLRQTEDVSVPRRSAIVKLTWRDGAGKMVPGDHDDLARPEYPFETGEPVDGWTLLQGIYQAPQQATRLDIELRLRWTQTGLVRYKAVTLEPAGAPAPRRVRLAAVHFQPHQGTGPQEKCALFEPMIAEAARQEADLVCLPESLTFYGSGKDLAEIAEPIPGPSSDYFARLAKKYDLYIAAGLTEKVGEALYNTAILVGPDMPAIGKYRKVCIPREEIEAGVTPGDQYPVFDTRFGKVGLMVCWDVHFPEVARRLANNGAEVIAMPIWGGNPALAKARAIENQIYLVSSTYSPAARNLMMSGVWDPRGELLVQNGKDFGTVHVAEVDLAAPVYWNWLGDFKARIHRERPLDR